MAILRKVKLSPWLVVLLAIGILLNEGALLLLSLCGVLLHEMGHIGMARRFGASVSEIRLSPFGGLTVLSGFSDLSPWEETEVALAGPLTSTMLAAVCGWVAHLLPHFSVYADLLMKINLALAVFNLLPLFPLDGGRILCRMAEGRKRGRLLLRVQTLFGLLTGLLLSLLGVLLGLVGGQFNITWMLCGAYLFAENIKRKKEQPFSLMQKVASREGLLSRRRILPVQLLAAAPDVTEGELLRQLQSGKMGCIIWLDEAGNELRRAWK